jgi:hypothetical protein
MDNLIARLKVRVANEVLRTELMNEEQQVERGKGLVHMMLEVVRGAAKIAMAKKEQCKLACGMSGKDKFEPTHPSFYGPSGELLFKKTVMYSSDPAFRTDDSCVLSLEEVVDAAGELWALINKDITVNKFAVKVHTTRKTARNKCVPTSLFLSLSLSLT